ncbi:MAG: MBL fold metallo-hydrolase [Candidatus Rifleibacteriota bacterium]
MNQELDYSQPIEIANGVYWVGFYDREAHLQCNPYLILDNEEAVLIDGGSRPDFPTVMMKILKAGVNPKMINALIYSHYDPDLCGSIPNLEGIIAKPDLKLISNKENHIFISHYATKSEFVDIKKINYEYLFKSGRKLQFILTPFAHAAGSFMTFDHATKTLFSGDLFGSYSRKWELYLRLTARCATCVQAKVCSRNHEPCQLYDIFTFHQNVMPSGKALRYAMKQVNLLPFERIAPQHGSIIDKETAKLVLNRLHTLDRVGIDKFEDM